MTDSISLKIKKVLDKPSGPYSSNTIYLINNNGNLELEVSDSTGKNVIRQAKPVTDYNELLNKPDLSTKADLIEGKINPLELPTIDKTFVGLDLIDNVASVDLPVSKATQLELNAKADETNPAFFGNVDFTKTAGIHGLKSSDVELGNVSNTSDLEKVTVTDNPVKKALDLKADLTQVFTRQEVTALFEDLVGGAPDTLNTIKELADVILSDENHISNIVDALNKKASLDSPSFSGSVKFDSVVSITGLTASMVKLGNVDNTSDNAKVTDAANPIKQALDLKADLVDGKIEIKQLPSSVLTNQVYSGTYDATRPLPTTNQSEVGYYKIVSVANDTYSVNDWIISNGVGWDHIPKDNIADKASIGLGKIDNTSDLEKVTDDANPIKQALDLKADLVEGKVSIDVIPDIPKENVGLGDVDNTSDLAKVTDDANPIKQALDLKAELVDGKIKLEELPTIDKSTVGLDNVDNTSDADKPVSILQQNSLDLKADLTNGYVPLEQMPVLNQTLVGLDNVDNTSDLTKVTSDFNPIKIALDAKQSKIVGDKDKVLITDKDGVISTSSITSGDLKALVGFNGTGIQELIKNKADLTSDKLIEASQIPGHFLGTLGYIGVFNPNVEGSLPTATVDNKSNYYVSTDNGNGFHIGDLAISNGVSWDKVRNTISSTSLSELAFTGNYYDIKNKPNQNKLFNVIGRLSPMKGDSVKWFPDRDIYLKNIYSNIGNISSNIVEYNIKINDEYISSSNFILSAKSQKSPMYNLIHIVKSTDYITVDILKAIDGDNFVITIIYE